MVLILNLVLCLLVIAMVVTPLARAISVSSRPQTGGSRRRRETAKAGSRASSRSFAPGV